MELRDYLQNDLKVYVEVNADFFSDGRILPRSFVWEDGSRYEVDKIIDVRRAASTRAGGAGLRYTVSVQNKQTYMFLEEDCGADKWFIERKQKAHIKNYAERKR